MTTPNYWTTTATHDQEVFMKILDFDLEGSHFIMESKEAQTYV